MKKYLLKIGFAILLMFICIVSSYAQIPRVVDIWKGLVAEDCYLRPKSWTYEDQEKLYINIAWVVRNRWLNNMSTGLVALKRKDLDKFVERNDNYFLAMRGWSINEAAGSAQSWVFFVGVPDPTNGATHYEHTGIYKVPKWAKRMKVTKVLFKGTKQEVTFWKEK